MTTPPDAPPEVEPLALEALLRWYLAMGVDIAVGDMPQDRFAEAGVRAGPPEGGGHTSLAAVVPPVADEGGLSRAAAAAPTADASRTADAARDCRTLEELKTAWAATPGCGLAATATHMIFAGGTARAKLMIVGGAPDSDDEREGQAFSGPKGRLLDAMLRAIGLSRAEAYLANVIPWRPPGNRLPTPAELAFCLPFARRHIELAAPAVLLCLGERAAQPLLATSDPVSRLRGRWMSHEGDTRMVKTLVTFSLDYLIRQPLQKRRAWADLLQVAAAFQPD